MDDDKLKRRPGQPRSATCGVCDTTHTRCPTCPRNDGSTGNNREWQKLRARNPDEYRVQHACATAARQLEITHESHMAYPEYLEAYRRACEARDAYWAAIRATLPKAKGSRYGGPLVNPAEGVDL